MLVAFLLFLNLVFFLKTSLSYIQKLKRQLQSLSLSRYKTPNSGKGGEGEKMNSKLIFYRKILKCHDREETTSKIYI